MGGEGGSACVGLRVAADRRSGRSTLDVVSATGKYFLVGKTPAESGALDIDQRDYDRDESTISAGTSVRQ